MVLLVFILLIGLSSSAELCSDIPPEEEKVLSYQRPPWGPLKCNDGEVVCSVVPDGSCHVTYVSNVLEIFSDVSMPYLEYCGYVRALHEHAGPELFFPALKKIGGFQLADTKITSVSFPVLEAIDTTGSFDITTNDVPLSLSFPSLTSLRYFSISRSVLSPVVSFPLVTNLVVGKLQAVRGLERLEFPLLEQAELQITNSTDLEVLDLPELTTAILYFRFNEKLQSASFPKLTSPLTVPQNGFYFGDHPVLESISFPLLKVGYSLDVHYNPSLTTLSVPLLETLNNNGLRIMHNHLLPSISFPSLLTASTVQVWLNQGVKELSFPSLCKVPGSYTNYVFGGEGERADCYICQDKVQWKSQIHYFNVDISEPETGCDYSC